MNRSRIPLEVLAEVGRLLTLFGVANDAFDHGSTAEAARLRERGTSGLRALVVEHPALLELAPRLPSMLDHGLLIYSWPTVLDVIENAIREQSTGP